MPPPEGVAAGTAERRPEQRRERGLRALAEGTALQVVGRLASAAGTFAALALAARALEPAGFAVLGAYLALWGILDVFIDLGSMTASLRAISADPQLERAAIARAFRLRAATAPLAFAVCALFATREDASTRAWILAASLGLAAHLLAPATLPLHREMRYRALSLARSAGSWMSALFVLGLALAGCAEPGPYLAAFAGGNLANACIARCSAPRPARARAPDIALLPWLKEALALGIAALARTAYFWIVVLLVRELCTESEAGQFNAAHRLFNVALLVATYASATALPLFAAAEPPRAELARIARALAGAGIALAIGIALGAEPLLVLAFGAPYAAAAPTLRALAAGIAMVHVSSWMLTRLTAEARGRAIAGISFAALCLNVALDLWWIPRYGGLGAAWATSTTEVSVVLMTAFALHRGARA